MFGSFEESNDTGGAETAGVTTIQSAVNKTQLSETRRTSTPQSRGCNSVGAQVSARYPIIRCRTANSSSCAATNGLAFRPVRASAAIGDWSPFRASAAWRSLARTPSGSDLWAISANPGASAVNLLYLRAFADVRLGAVHLRKGDLKQAFHLAQHWLQTYAVADLPMSELIMVASLGEVFNVLDHIEETLALHERAWQFAESKSIFAFGAQVLAVLGEAYGRARRIDEAVSSGQRALDLARRLGQRGVEARALFLLGNIHG